MIYRVLRWITGIALYWFYRDILVTGHERIPRDGPLLIAVNHQNALVDSLITTWIMPRRIAMTAKATLADNALIALFFRMLNVVPLRRTTDEMHNSGGSAADRSRNNDAFRDILSILEHSGAVLIFPEGKSHNLAGLEPLKTGLARVALQARDQRGIKGIRILPLGLVFEDKGTPGTVAEARVGEVIEMDAWPAANYAALTQEIADRLRVVSETTGISSQQPENIQRTKGLIRGCLIGLAASWGRLTHRVPIRIARKIAINRSTDADEPAMFTIMVGLGLVLLTYVIHIAIVGVLTHSVWIAFLYLAGLVSGAYWAAFEDHPHRY